MNSKKTTTLLNQIFLALFFTLLGYFFHSYIQMKQVPQKNDLSLFWSVWEKMEEKYPFEEPKDEDKIYAAISGLVSSYDDDYSVFFEPDDSKFFKETIVGEFGGAGMEIAVRNGALTIIAPLKDSPAERAGLLAGDIISHVDDIDVLNKTFNDAISLIRGDVGTDATLTILRKGLPDPIDVTFTREIVHIPILDTEIMDDTFVIHLYNFNEFAEEEFKLSLVEFKESGKKELILDLRNNPGGYLLSSIEMASYFLDQGEIIVREKGKGEDTVYRSSGYDLLKGYEYKTIVLINEGSASASEILAAALSEHDVAVLAGETSFGKGSVQDFISMDHGTSLKVTIAKWFTPLENQISEIGIEPDFLISPDYESALDTQLLDTIALFD